ncbi:MAG TPA: chemotaxis protein CheB [Chitinophagaceae bacterium]|nr:chemotaxis protein CheB [Chitinophagaceae bacterium]
MAEPKYILVVGASAGGLNSVTELCAQLKEEMHLAVFVVIHLNPASLGGILLQRIQRSTAYKCVEAEDGANIKSNHIYMVLDDKHLVVKKGKIVLGDGPAENRWRPSIDILFRSAAAAYGSSCFGVILSGMLQDGTAGMLALKRCGGTCIVQDPKQAEYPDMPQSVLDNVEIDYSVPLEQMGAILFEKTRNGVKPHICPDDVKAEAEIAEKSAVGIDRVSPIGEKSLFSCPDCGGGLWEMKNESFTRYRCHTGHVYSEKDLLLKHNEALENTLWVALRMMEERRNLLKKMSAEELSKGWIRSAGLKKEREKDLEDHIDRLRNILFDAKELGNDAISKAG